MKVNNKNASWQPVIGLEVHAKLATKTKIFSPSSTEFGLPPNTQADMIDLAMPGVLPVLNEAVVDMAIRFALATNAEIAPVSVFARKNYFYPDLPKGYQISQYESPIVGKGTVTIYPKDEEPKTVTITRAHLEEDAGKSLHENYIKNTGIDLNRSGAPLLEIVSEPELFSVKEAVTYAKKIHSIVCYINICDGNMQEGSFRVDANISLHLPGEPYGTRAEIKNINSFKFLEKALNFEIERQKELLNKGEKIIQETRLYDSALNETRSMRTKENAHDYRYFPDPDLLPLHIDQQQIEQIRKELPELPDQKKQRFIETYQLSEYDANVLTDSKEIADFYETICEQIQGSYKICANWMMGDFLGYLNKDNYRVHESPVNALQLADIIRRIVDKTISGKIAKDIFDHLWKEGGNVDEIIDQKGLRQISDSSAVSELVDQILSTHPQQVEQYQSGKDKLMGFFVGEIMKASQGKANPAEVNRILKSKLQP